MCGNTYLNYWRYTMLQLTTTQQEKIKSLISEFDLDNKTDYTRISGSLTNIIGKTPDNDFIWLCVNKIKKAAVAVDGSFLD